MRIDTRAVFVQCKWESDKCDAAALNRQKGGVSMSAVVGKFKPIVPLPADRARI